MNLLVDIGNSRIKWGMRVNKTWQSWAACGYNQASPRESIEPAWRGLPGPDSIFIANVAGDKVAAELALYVETRWAVSPEFLSVERQAAGVVNGYDAVEQLGVDRWLAMIAAWNTHQSAVCIIDCGTAVTVDVVAASGQHAGGFIVPGLALMRAALNRNTQQINIPAGHRASLAPGRNTADCTGNGALMSITAFIRQVVAGVVREYGTESHFVITGGGAEELRTFLEVDFDYQPRLVLNGMALLTDNV